MNGLTYVVLGAGRQGLAAAHDLALHGGAARIRLADADLRVATAAALRLDDLAGRPVAEPVRVDANGEESLRAVLRDAQAALSALPYRLNPRVAAAAVAARCHLADLGGNAAVSRRVLDLDDAARAARVTLIPDCGLAPGLSATLTAYLVATLDETRAIRLRCGGLPQRPRGPLGYQLVFSIEGLTNEYQGQADVLRGGRLSKVPTLDELEELEFPDPVGRCEAFTTSGGTSTLPLTYRGRILDLDYKTVRYAGHCAHVRALRDLGLLSDEPVTVGGARVKPRDLFHAVAAPALSFGDPDLVVLRAEASGRQDGRDVTVRLDVLDFADPGTGFTAMQRMTGTPAAMVVAALARGEGRPGAVPLELALPPAPLVSGLAARGIRFVETREG